MCLRQDFQVYMRNYCKNIDTHIGTACRQINSTPGLSACLFLFWQLPQQLQKTFKNISIQSQGEILILCSKAGQRH